MIFGKLFMIALIWVCILDISGFVDEIEKVLGKWLNCKVRIPKPFSCSLCMTWWTSLIYIIITHHFTLGWIAVSIINAVLTPQYNNFLILIKEIVDKAVSSFGKMLGL